jgi:pimeloyl-ACP methyl ester carboxylesterase
MGEIAKVNNIDIWWEDYGEKSNPTVLLIMGANANCMQWSDQLIQELVANNLHVVIFDNRDVGESTWFNKEPFISKVAKLLPLSISSKLINYVFTAMTDAKGNFALAGGSNAKYDLDDMAKDAIALMDHLNIDKAHIVGVSMGGMITQVIGLDYPERTLTLTPIMSSPGMGDPNLSGMTPSLVEGIKESFLLNIQGKYEDGLVRIYKELTGSRFPFDEKKFREELKPIMAHGHNPHAGHGEAVGASPNRKERLHEIKVPTLVIHGTEDAILPLDHGMVLVDNIPNAKKYILDGVGHEIPEELLPEIITEMTALFKQTKDY